MRPSRARLASTRVPLASSPKRVATPLGDSSSTSVCHSTACQRSGSERKACMAIDCSASCMARTSAPRSRVSSSETSLERAACWAKTAKSSTRCSRFADFCPARGDAAHGGQQIGAHRVLEARCRRARPAACGRRPRRSGRRRCARPGGRCARSGGRPRRAGGTAPRTPSRHRHAHPADQIGVGRGQRRAGPGCRGSLRRALPLHGDGDVRGRRRGLAGRTPGTALIRNLLRRSPSGTRTSTVGLLLVPPVNAHRGKPRPHTLTRPPGKSATRGSPWWSLHSNHSSVEISRTRALPFTRPWQAQRACGKSS